MVECLELVGKLVKSNVNWNVSERLKYSLSIRWEILLFIGFCCWVGEVKWESVDFVIEFFFVNKILLDFLNFLVNMFFVKFDLSWRV